MPLVKVIDAYKDEMFIAEFPRVPCVGEQIIFRELSSDPTSFNVEDVYWLMDKYESKFIEAIVRISYNEIELDMRTY